MAASLPSAPSQHQGDAISRIRYWKIGIVIALAIGIVLMFAAIMLRGATPASAQSPIPQYQQLIHSVEGPDLFRAYCASCHGHDGKGNGPAAAALKVQVPDLTVLSYNNKGQFPAARVRNMIMGDDVVASHGSREMPIWGPIFHQVEADVDKGYVRQENLVKYLESIQSLRPAAASIQAGAELYKRRCAACHGNDLKGVGPAPPPFKEYTPDLSTMAKRNGGVFPDAFFANVLRNGAPIPEHGPAEMPVWGLEFRQSEKLDEAQVAARIASLADYIKSLQAK